MIEDATIYCIENQYFMGKPVLHEIYRGWTGKYRLLEPELCIPAYQLCKNSSCIHSTGQYNGTHVERTKELMQFNSSFVNSCHPDRMGMKSDNVVWFWWD